MNVLGFATGGWIGGTEAFDTGGVCADIGAGAEGGGSVWSCTFLFRLLIFPEATCFGAPLLSDDRAGLFFIPVCPAPITTGDYFLGLRFACARSDAIGPRSRFGVLGLRKSFPACDASRLDVVIVFSPAYRWWFVVVDSRMPAVL